MSSLSLTVWVEMMDKRRDEASEEWTKFPNRFHEMLEHMKELQNRTYQEGVFIEDLGIYCGLKNK